MGGTIYTTGRPGYTISERTQITGLRANLSARAICHTHEKSYSAEKVLFIEYSSFNPLFMFTSGIFE